MTDKIVVLSTCAKADDAEKLARTLVTEKLAACVSVVPRVHSYYLWKGELETADEFLLIIKTSRELFDALKLELEKLHPFEVPEVLALPIVAGTENYLNWMAHNLRGGSPE